MVKATLSPPTLTGGQKTVRSHEPQDDPGPVKVSVDWLSATFKPDIGDALGTAERWHGDDPIVDDVDMLRSKVLLAASLALGCELEDWYQLEHGRSGYRQALLGPQGARLDYDAPGRADMNLSLPGKACQLVGEVALRRLITFALMHKANFTRLDVNLDDYSRVVSPDVVLGALQGPDVVTHAQKVLVQRGCRVGSEALTGETVYLGSPTSRQRLRCYDKGLESDGEQDCVRWELQARDEAACTLASMLAYRDWGQVITSRLVSYVDFKDHDSHSEIEQRIRLPWFEKLVAGARKASAYLPKVPRTVDDLVGWLTKAIGPSLAVVMTAWRGDLNSLNELLEDGRSRWKPKHKAMLAAAG